MNEPIQQAALQSAGAIVSGMFFAALGIDSQGFIWSVVGCVLGLGLAKTSSAWYALALFVSASLTCALIGTAASEYWFHGAPLARNFMAVLFGAGFHPVLAAFIAAVPSLVGAVRDFVVRRIGGDV